MRKNECPVRDERIEKANNALAAKLLPVMLILQVIVLAAKLALGGWGYCLLDVLALLVGGGLAAALLTVKGVWRAGDETLEEIRALCLSRAFMAMLTVLVVGEFACMLLDEANIGWYAPSLIVWGIPALVYTVRVVRRGLFQWGGQKAETKGKAQLAKSTAIGALFFGIVMGGGACIKDGAFNPAGLLRVLGMAAGWGVLFYLMFTFVLKLGGKQADRELAEAEAAENGADDA